MDSRSSGTTTQPHLLPSSSCANKWSELPSRSSFIPVREKHGDLGVCEISRPASELSCFVLFRRLIWGPAGQKNRVKAVGVRVIIVMDAERSS